MLERIASLVFCFNVLLCFCLSFHPIILTPRERMNDPLSDQREAPYELAALEVVLESVSGVVIHFNYFTVSLIRFHDFVMHVKGC
jgi:hypothetical protein